MAFLDQDGLSVVLSSLKTKLTELYNTLYAAKSHNHSYTDLTNKPTIDTALSNTSTNAVQNKAIYTELEKKVNTSNIKDNLTSTDTDKPLSAAQGKMLKDAIDGITTDIGNLGGGDMMKATYDTDNSGVVDNAEKLDGQAASYYENVYYGTCRELPSNGDTWEVTVLNKTNSTSQPSWINTNTILAVKFSLGGGSQSSKLKVNGWTGNVLGLDGSANAATIGWYVDQTVQFLWDGENWRQLTPTFASFTKYGISMYTQEIPSSENNSVLTSYKTGQAINAAKQEITNLIPTNNNQLTNGAGYQTETQVNNLIKTAVAKVVTYGESLAFASLTGKNVAANAYLMYNITDEFTTTADFKEGAGKKCPAGTNVVVVPNGSGYVFDLFYGAFEVPALTATEINAAFTAAGY